MMKLVNHNIIVSIIISILFFSLAHAGVESQGIDSKESYKRVMDNLTNTFIIDVRTRAEYEFVGHPDMPNGVPNIPYKFYPTWEVNMNFVKKVEERYKKEDTIIIICRSGKRAKAAAKPLKDSGFQKVFHMTDSFEGPKDKKGHRTVGGWKVNDLPYTYKLENHLVYR
tara:strand:- start:1515 stop:2018 length:504 start_codon:yes stop_codon:yes gene_type:complete